MKEEPLVTIITATYNADEWLQGSIQSVMDQSYTHYEYIIIDGASTDCTVEIIKQHQSQINYWVSEKDNGIYDAWNKGLKHAKGEWILFIGADDRLLPNAVESYINFIKANSHLNFDYISSKIKRINPDGTLDGIVGKPWLWKEFKYRMTTAHPGSFHSKSFFAKYGEYNTQYKIVSDYEILLRAKDKLRTGFVDELTLLMSTGTNLQKKDAIYEALTVLKKSRHLTFVQYTRHYVYAILGLFYREKLKKLLS